MTPPGNNYRIFYADEVISDDIPRLPKTMKESVRRAIETRLMTDPVAYGKPLRYSLKGHRRLCVGDWRIVYRIEAETKKVLIVAIKHRKDVYED